MRWAMIMSVCAINLLLFISAIATTTVHSYRPPNSGESSVAKLRERSWLPMAKDDVRQLTKTTDTMVKVMRSRRRDGGHQRRHKWNKNIVENEKEGKKHRRSVRSLHNVPSGPNPISNATPRRYRNARSPPQQRD